MPIEIRKPDIEDVNIIAALHLAAWKQAYDGMVPAHVLDELLLNGFISRWQERIVNPKPAEHVRIASRNQQISGFIMFGESREAMNLSKFYGKIYALYVHPNQWRMGAG